MSISVRKLKRRVAKMVGDGLDFGCSDSGCIFGHEGGMGTNAGCYCLKGDKHDLRINLLRMSRVANALAEALVTRGILREVESKRNDEKVYEK